MTATPAVTTLQRLRAGPAATLPSPAAARSPATTPTVRRRASQSTPAMARPAASTVPASGAGRRPGWSGCDRRLPSVPSATSGVDGGVPSPAGGTDPSVPPAGSEAYPPDGYEASNGSLVPKLPDPSDPVTPSSNVLPGSSMSSPDSPPSGGGSDPPNSEPRSGTSRVVSPAMAPPTSTPTPPLPRSTDNARLAPSSACEKRGSDPPASTTAACASFATGASGL